MGTPSSQFSSWSCDCVAWAGGVLASEWAADREGFSKGGGLALGQCPLVDIVVPRAEAQAWAQRKETLHFFLRALRQMVVFWALPPSLGVQGLRPEGSIKLSFSFLTLAVSPRCRGQGALGWVDTYESSLWGQEEQFS